MQWICFADCSACELADKASCSNTERRRAGREIGVLIAVIVHTQFAIPRIDRSKQCALLT